MKLLGVCLIALHPGRRLRRPLEGYSLPLLGTPRLRRADVPDHDPLDRRSLANLVNLIDGMDALAAGIVSIAAVLVRASSRPRSAAPTPPRSPPIICGATLAFLRHNYHPARIIMGDTGALALGLPARDASRSQGVLKTAATIALVVPLLVLAVPILDTSFVVLKRLKYGRSPRRPTRTTSTTGSCGSGTRSGARPPTCTCGPRCSRRGRSSSASCRRGRRGEWDLENALIVGAVGLVVVATSLWMIYSLEILKARHLRVLGLSRDADDEAEQEPSEEPAARALSGTRR